MIASPLYFVVHAVDEHRRVVLRRGRQHDLLRAGVEVLLRGGLVEEQAGGFDDDVGADFVPLQVGRIAFLGQADLLAVDDQGVAFDLHVALEAAVHGVVAQHVGQVVRLQQVVDGDDLDVVAEVLHGRAQHVASDAAEAVDANLDRHSWKTPAAAPWRGGWTETRHSNRRCRFSRGGRAPQPHPRYPAPAIHRPRNRSPASLDGRASHTVRALTRWPSLLLLLVSRHSPGTASPGAASATSLVGDLAWDDLTAEHPRRIARLLAGEAEPTLAGVANWADELRDNDPDAAASGRPSWHYVNFAEDGCRYVQAKHCPNGRRLRGRGDPRADADPGRPHASRRRHAAMH